MKRKAKKHGFTLVEVVVVLAIIAVLAALLIPTLIGVVQDSRVASSNQAARLAMNRANEFLVKMDGNKSGYRGGEVTIVVKAEHTIWSMSGGNGAEDWADGENHWTTVPQVKAPDVTLDTATEFLAYVAASLHLVNTCYAEIHIKNNRVIGVAMIEGSSNAADIMPQAQNFDSGTFDFGGSNKAGVEDNVVIGTAPVLYLPQV